MSAGASGAPLTSAMPSLTPGSYGATPRRASASAAGTGSPSSSTVALADQRLEQVAERDDLAGASRCRATGTTGVHPSLSRAARNSHSAGDTPAAPARKPVRRSSIAPRTTSGASGGPVPGAADEQRALERPLARRRPARVPREVAEAGVDAVRADAGVEVGEQPLARRVDGRQRRGVERDRLARRRRSGGTARGRAGRAARGRSSVRQQRADVLLDRAVEDRLAERDVGRRQAAVPEQDALVVGLAARAACRRRRRPARPRSTRP